MDATSSPEPRSGLSRNGGDGDEPVRLRKTSGRSGHANAIAPSAHEPAALLLRCPAPRLAGAAIPGFDRNDASRPASSPKGFIPAAARFSRGLAGSQLVSGCARLVNTA